MIGNNAKKNTDVGVEEEEDRGRTKTLNTEEFRSVGKGTQDFLV